ncbi:MAG: TauD/TfdA family dioxygenase [Betaproteobacteria bacterium]|nr:TauD/TfdA family dioxygenase [Betaproteobacteria bacterium]
MTHALIKSPADWRAAEIAVRSDWIHQLSVREVSEIEAALAGVKQKGTSIAEVDKENFPLQLFPRLVTSAHRVLEEDCGMFLIRGLPVERHSVEDMRLVYWALGQYLGRAVSQSSKGDVLGDVRDMSRFNDGRGRGYQSRRRLEFHTDSCDVVGLLVVRTAKEGGRSMIASSVALHNQMLRERPDLVESLYGVFSAYSPGERAGGYWTQPVFSDQNGYFACKTGYVYFRLAAEKFPEKIPALTAQQIAALELFQDIANRPEMHLSMSFAPGDLQLLNNHVMLHARGDFEDYEEEDRKRHLLRLWLSVPNSRPLSPLMKDVYRDVTPGAWRGGYPSESGKIVYHSNATLD